MMPGNCLFVTPVGVFNLNLLRATLQAYRDALEEHGETNHCTANFAPTGATDIISAPPVIQRALRGVGCCRAWKTFISPSILICNQSSQTVLYHT